jgi:hypothetical protein
VRCSRAAVPDQSFSESDAQGLDDFLFMADTEAVIEVTLCLVDEENRKDLIGNDPVG